MTPQAGRTQACNRGQAIVRLNQARAFLEVAELVGTEEDELANDNVAAALAVLAGIAAADAACCATLGRLIDIKDGAHYGMVYVGAQQAKIALRNASTLVHGAARLLT